MSHDILVDTIFEKIDSKLVHVSQENSRFDPPWTDHDRTTSDRRVAPFALRVGSQAGRAEAEDVAQAPS
jgi:hypothetical protein